MSGCAGILGTRCDIGHFGTGGFRATAAQTLSRKAIREQITGVVPDFQPPVVNRLICGGKPETFFNGQTLEDRTLADILWTVAEDHGNAFTALRKIFQANLQMAGLTLKEGIKSLGEVFGPFYVRDYLYCPILVQDTSATRTLLEAGGLTRLESAEGLASTPVRAAYAVKDGLIVTDWRNAHNVRLLSEWAINVSLAFLPYYKAVNDVELGNPATRAIVQIINACQLGGRNLSFFWLGRSSVPAAGSDGWMPHAAVIDPPKAISLPSLRDSRAPQTAAIFLTPATEK